MSHVTRIAFGALVVFSVVAVAHAQPLAYLEAHAIVPIQPITFHAGSTTTDTDGELMLEAVAHVLRANTTVTIEVGVHTDARGSAEYNLRISQARADAIRSFLIAAGVPASRVTARGYGESRPIVTEAPNGTSSVRGRVEFVRTDVP
jgi:OOP family OmpA-OmpF porin